MLARCAEERVQLSLYLLPRGSKLRDAKLLIPPAMRPLMLRCEVPCGSAATSAACCAKRATASRLLSLCSFANASARQAPSFSPALLALSASLPTPTRNAVGENLRRAG